MADPAIKGTLFALVVEDLHAAIDSGATTREEVEARLEAEDIVLAFDTKVAPPSWYDIFSYHRIVDVLCDLDPAPPRDYWFQRGRRAAQRMIEMGIYQQLDYLGRIEYKLKTEQGARFEAFGRDMRLLMTLHASMLNFGQWTCSPESDGSARYRVEIHGVSGIPDGIFIAASGVFTGLGEHSRGNVNWTFLRPEPGVAVIRMNDPL